MRLDLRRVRELVARLLCLCLLSVVISSCFISYYRSEDIVEKRNCPNIDNNVKKSILDKGNSSASEDLRKCQTIHIALICGGHDATREFYTLLKSILFYRIDSKLRLHLFVNNVSEKIIRELFRTWIVPDLDVVFYHLSDHEHEISWIPNAHYSNRYGLLKLVAPIILAEAGVERVICLDTDMLAHGDIIHLWNEFSRLDESPEAFIGLVENQSDWYLDVHNTLPQAQAKWPALGRGFNTGMILIDLIKLKQSEWNSMWRDSTEMELISHLTTVLADQDIYNAVIKRHSSIVVRLDCHFNLQLNDHSLLNVTCPGHRARKSFSLTHWNSPRKIKTRNNQATYYKSWYTTFINWNAKLLERSSCSETILGVDEDLAVGPTGIIEETCQEIRPRPHERLRTFSYFLNFELVSDHRLDVTAVVHLSMDRVRALEELAAHWLGPMSVALYLSETDTSQLVDLIETSESLAGRRNIGYHLVFRDSGSNYPINRLRNIALNNAITPFVFLIDVDFLPTQNLYDYLRTTLKRMSDENGQESLRNRALIVPVFENNEYKFEIPRGKAELIQQLDLGTISQFRASIWPQGQSATNYERWKVATKPYKVEWRPEYEPFIVTGANVTRFDERFNGFGWNKVEHIMQLAALNYEFYVLPEAFAIHQFHPASYDISRHRDSKKYQACIRLLKQSFLSELRQLHPNFTDTLARRLVEKSEII